MRNRAAILFILLVVFLPVHLALSQVNELVAKNRNSITLRTAFYSFLDGGPTIQTNYTNRPHWLSNSYGIGYTRQIDSINQWGSSLDFYSFVNHEPVTTMQRGTYWNRSFVDLRAKYVRSIYSRNRFELFAAAAISLRIGNEGIFGSYWLSIDSSFGETFVLSKALFDGGISIGIKPQFYLGKHFHIYTSLDYTCYVYTYDSKDLNYSWDPGPTWNMFRLSFGLGFNFGELKEK